LGCKTLHIPPYDYAAFFNDAAGADPNLLFAARLRMADVFDRLLGDDGQDVAEYAVMLAVVLAVVVGTIRLIGSNANNVFSSVGSSIQ
jgi:Flp pilus assembly pilin Flp